MCILPLGGDSMHNFFIKLKSKITDFGKALRNAFRFQKGNFWDQVLRVGVVLICLVFVLAWVGSGFLFSRGKDTAGNQVLTAEQLSDLVRQELDRLLSDEYYWVMESSITPVYPEEPPVPAPAEPRPEPLEIVEEVEEEVEEVLAISFDRILWPVNGEISTEFGWYRHPVYLDWRYNGGVNLALNGETEVRAVLNGRVESIKPCEHGFEVIVQHGSDWKTVYRDINLLTVSVGETVKENQVLAASSPTKEIFFGLLYQGEPVDPMQYMSLY